MARLAFVRSVQVVWLFMLLLLLTLGAASSESNLVPITVDGKSYGAYNDRRPALYTADFGDCLGKSAVNVTRFDAAYYKDNMTVIFHLQGETALVKENVMMSIGVYAYGERRFELIFNPCSANIGRQEVSFLSQLPD